MTPLGWVSMVVLWVVVIGVVVWAVTRIVPAVAGAGHGGASQAGDHDDPDRLLERRLASGEIDPHTYDQIRTRLDAARRSPG
ncbi:MAG: hypothetical protein U0Y82_02130 [Thermoleophilia bacterium]